ncbi:MAG: fatty acid metabolism transcriptional regulator FadR [Ardenticatenaceae bacterium]|nr:fatty acid metabolism transcriptional regulator FadR [Ardenticatenaceae bacterium]
MNNWSAPQRPNDYAEQSLVTAILEGTFALGHTLPGERALAAELGVTRPTLREALQRLARDGWLTVQQGKSTVVNNFWQDGGLNVLSALVQHSDHLPPNFVANLLEVRLHLAPAYTRAAVERAGDEVAAFIQGSGLRQAQPTNPTAAAYASFDWQLHRLLTTKSGNPIYTLILNGFANFYEEIAQLYFATNEARQLSCQFYEDLTQVAANHDAATAEHLARTVMEASIRLWQETKSAGE